MRYQHTSKNFQHITEHVHTKQICCSFAPLNVVNTGNSVRIIKMIKNTSAFRGHCLKTQYIGIKCTQYKILSSYNRTNSHKPTYTHTSLIPTNGYLTICLFCHEMFSPSHYQCSNWTVILQTALYVLRSYTCGLTQNLNSSPHSICSMCHAVAIKQCSHAKCQG
jgi:hypothetical protein